MHSARRHDKPVVITSADRSFDDEQHERKRVYTILMIIHILGFTAAGLVAMTQLWWLALALVVLTGALPWVAVIFANDRRPRPPAASRRTTRFNRMLPSGPKGT